MSKIGDVIVKLLLDSDEYERGLSKGKKSTQDFSKKITGGFTAAIGKVAALGAAIAGIAKVFGQVSSANQKFGDKWQEFTSGLKGSWDEFARAIATLDFSNLLDRMKSASDAARELYNAVDAMGEITTSYNIASAQELKHLAELRIAMNDQNKSYDERIAAAKEWLEISERLNSFPLRGLARVQDATITKTLTQMGTDLSKLSDDQIAYIKKSFIEFFKWLGTEAGENAYAKINGAHTKEGIASGQYAKTFQNMERNGDAPGGRMWLYWLTQYADKVNDEEREALEKSIVDFLKADAAFAETSRRVHNTLNTVLYQKANAEKKNKGSDTIVEDAKAKTSELRKLSEELGNLPALGFDGLPNTVEQLSTSMPDIISDEWLERQRQQSEKMLAQFEDLKYKCEDVAWSLNNAVQQGIVNAIDELAGAVASGEDVDGGAVVKALLSPLADACISAGLLIMTTGTAVEALRDTLIAGLATGGWAAIAAGTALVAVGAAAKIGLAAIGTGKKSGTATTSSAAASSAGPSTQNINSELTIYVKGSISGSDILLSGQRTISSRRR